MGEGDDTDGCELIPILVLQGGCRKFKSGLRKNGSPPRTADLAKNGHSIAVPLLIQSGTEDGHNEVGKVGRAIIELQPADDAVVGQIF